jgi:hypothetical protein
MHSIAAYKGFRYSHRIVNFILEYIVCLYFSKLIGAACTDVYIKKCNACVIVVDVHLASRLKDTLTLSLVFFFILFISSLYLTFSHRLITIFNNIIYTIAP